MGQSGTKGVRWGNTNTKTETKTKTKTKTKYLKFQNVPNFKTIPK